MNQKIYSIYHYFQHFIKAGNAHGLHSPFVYKLYTEVISRKESPKEEFKILKIKKALLKDNKKLKKTDFGAGSMNKREKSIKEIAKYSTSSRKKSLLLFRLVQFFQPKVILELGTSLGVNSAYLKYGNKNAKLLTFEGCPNLVEKAKSGFSELDIDIEVIQGNIDNTLQEALERLGALDFVYFDANHKEKPTLQYFEKCLAKSSKETVFVLDDIYWSAEMSRAWYKIINDERVKLSIDLYHLGLVFFRNKQPKQHFKLKF